MNLTRLQQQIRTFVQKHERVTIITGYKTTIMKDHHPEIGPVIGCSMNVMDGIRRQNLLETEGSGSNIWRIPVSQALPQIGGV